MRLHISPRYHAAPQLARTFEINHGKLAVLLDTIDHIEPEKHFNLRALLGPLGISEPYATLYRSKALTPIFSAVYDCPLTGQRLVIRGETALVDDVHVPILRSISVGSSILENAFILHHPLDGCMFKADVVTPETLLAAAKGHNGETLSSVGWTVTPAPYAVGAKILKEVSRMAAGLSALFIAPDYLTSGYIDDIQRQITEMFKQVPLNLKKITPEEKQALLDNEITISREYRASASRNCNILNFGCMAIPIRTKNKGDLQRLANELQPFITACSKLTPFQVGG